jgi:hypothetical protein
MASGIACCGISVARSGVSDGRLERQAIRMGGVMMDVRAVLLPQCMAADVSSVAEMQEGDASCVTAWLPVRVRTGGRWPAERSMGDRRPAARWSGLICGHTAESARSSQLPRRALPTVCRGADDRPHPGFPARLRSADRHSGRRAGGEIGRGDTPVGPPQRRTVSRIRGRASPVVVPRVGRGPTAGLGLTTVSPPRTQPSGRRRTLDRRG